MQHSLILLSLLTYDLQPEGLALLGLRVDLALVDARVFDARVLQRQRPLRGAPSAGPVPPHRGAIHGEAPVAHVDEATHRQDVHVRLANPGHLKKKAVDFVGRPTRGECRIIALSITTTRNFSRPTFFQLGTY